MAEKPPTHRLRVYMPFPEDRPPIPPPPEPPRSSWELVLHYLLEINTWKRVGIALVLGLALLTGHLVYTNQERVFSVIDALTRETPAPREVKLLLSYELHTLLQGYFQ